RVGKDDQTLVLQDLAQETVLRRFTSPEKERPYFSASAITPNGSHVAAILRTARNELEREPAENDPAALIAVWEAGTGTLVRKLTHPATATELALAPDASLLAVGDTRGNIALWNLPGGSPYATRSVGENRIQCLAFGRDPRRHFRQEAGTPAWQLAV